MSQPSSLNEQLCLALEPGSTAPYLCPILTSKIHPGIPPVFTTRELAHLLGISLNYLLRLAYNTSAYYTEFYINKKTREVSFETPEELEGIRVINSPKRPLKNAQKNLADSIFSKLDVHPCNFAYVKKRRALDVCSAHAGTTSLAKLDMKDFFPSHSKKYITSRLISLLGLPYSVCETIACLCVLKGKMPQGSPCSPILSLALNADKDLKTEILAKELNLRYTRYADDLHFSPADPLLSGKKFVEFVVSVQGIWGPDLLLNKKKCKLSVMQKDSYHVLRIEKWSELSEEQRSYAISVFGSLKLDLYLNDTLIYGFSGDKFLALISSSLEGKGFSYNVYSTSTIQVPRILGLHIFDTPGIPAKEVSRMRGLAFRGREGHLSPKQLARFKGKLNYIKCSDPVAFDKINKVFTKPRASAK